MRAGWFGGSGHRWLQESSTGRERPPRQMAHISVSFAALERLLCGEHVFQHAVMVPDIFFVLNSGIFNDGGGSSIREDMLDY